MTDSQTIRFLIVDDEQNIRRLCVTVGSALGFECVEAESAENALINTDSALPDIVVTDLKLPGSSGVDLLREVKSRVPQTEVAIMTGHGSIESAVDAMKLGAYDYIEKPFRVEKLRLLLQRM
ncbi:MAG: response regulator, partial [Candidatus Acidiferrales bacterium]